MFFFVFVSAKRRQIGYFRISFSGTRPRFAGQGTWRSRIVPRSFARRSTVFTGPKINRCPDELSRRHFARQSRKRERAQMYSYYYLGPVVNQLNTRPPAVVCVFRPCAPEPCHTPSEITYATRRRRQGGGERIRPAISSTSNGNKIAVFRTYVYGGGGGESAFFFSQRNPCFPSFFTARRR